MSESKDKLDSSIEARLEKHEKAIKSLETKHACCASEQAKNEEDSGKSDLY